MEARKQSLYFPSEMLDDLRAEAKRLDRSLSWVVQYAFRIAKAQIRRLPGPGEIIDELKNP